MSITLPEEGYEAILECWRVSPNTVKVVVQANKRKPHDHYVRITAEENVKSGAQPRYFAGYEEPVTVQDAEGVERDVWVDARYPWQDGRTIEECLVSAMRWVIKGDE
jgi:hypothetical protein